MTISTLVNPDRKGGAYPVMLQQFRRAICRAIVWGNVQHKLARLHYVRATSEEAAAICKANHRANIWKPNGRASWFSEHIIRKVMGLLNSLGTYTSSVYISYTEKKSKTTCNTE